MTRSFFRQRGTWLLALCSLILLTWSSCRQRVWTSATDAKACDPWQQKGLQVASTIAAAASEDERQGVVGCLLLSRGDAIGEIKIARLRPSGALEFWRDGSFQDADAQDAPKTPADAAPDAPFRFQFFAFRDPLQVAKDNLTKVADTRAVLYEDLRTSVCNRYTPKTYESCLLPGGDCWFVLEFQPKPPEQSLQLAPLSPATDTTARLPKDAKTCGLYVPSSSLVAEPKAEPTPEPQAEPAPEPIAKDGGGEEPVVPEPRPEPPPERRPPAMCGDPCAWSTNTRIIYTGKNPIHSFGMQHKGEWMFACSDKGCNLFGKTSGPSGFTYRNSISPTNVTIVSLHWSPNSDFFVIGMRDGMLAGSVAGLQRQQPIYNSKIQNATLTYAALNHNTSQLLAMTKEGKLLLWTFATPGTRSAKEPPQEVRLIHGAPLLLAVHPKKNELAIASISSTKRNKLSIFADDGKGGYKFEASFTPSRKITALAYQPDGKALITGLESGEVFRVLPPYTKNPELFQFQTARPEGKILRLSFSLDGKRLLALEDHPSTMAKRRLRLWKPGENGALYTELGWKPEASALGPWRDALMGRGCHSLFLASFNEATVRQSICE